MTMSSIAIRLWMNQAKLVATSSIAAIVANRRPLANHIARAKANSPKAPNKADGIRQNSGLSPSAQIAAAIISLASSGCSGLAEVSFSIARAAGI